MGTNYTRNAVSTVPEVNAELQKIDVALQDTLSRSGASPNQMESTLDMNSNRIINLPVPVNGSDAARLIDVQNGNVPTAIGTDKVVTNVATMVADVTLAVGDVVNTRGYYVDTDQGGGTYFIKSAASVPSPDGWSEITLNNGNVAVLQIGSVVNVDQFGASADTSIDSRPPIQAAIEYAQRFKSVSDRRVVTSAGNSYTLKTRFTGTLPTHATGDTFGLWVEDAQWCWFNFNGGRIVLDGDNATVAQLTAMIGVVQEAGDQAFMNIKNMRVDGGVWTDINNEPDYNVKFDYNVAKYSQFENVVCRRAKESNMRYVGFVLKFNYCDNRQAQNGAGFEARVTSLDGDNATRTGHNYTNCTTDTCGNYGFWMSGGNGHTYCQWVNCNADNIGRDRNGNTIVANIATAASYRISAGFGIEMSSLGSERSTRFARFSGVRSLHVDSAYTVNMGSTDAGNPVDYNIKIDGFSEEIRISGQRLSSAGYLNPGMKTLEITTPSGFNTTQVTTDIAIPSSQVDVVVTNVDSSAPYTVARFDDLWFRGNRNPGGDALLIGDPDPGRQSSDNFDQVNFISEKNFKFQTDGTAPQTFTILDLTNAANTGNGTCYLEVMVARSSGSTPTAPTRWKLSAGSDSGNKVIGPTEAEYNDVLTDPTLAWNGDTLELTINNTFSAVYVKATYLGRASAGFQTRNWGPTNG